MDIEARIQASECLIKWLDTKIDGLNIPSEDRSRIAGACLDMALEHQKAIVLLCAHELNGSAVSLIRSEFEAYIRGVWILYCAQDSAIEKFKRDKLDKSIGELIKDLEERESFDVGVLSYVKARSWGPMNSYTHTGILQVVRRLNDREIVPTYEEGEICEALDTANSFGLMAAIAIADMAGDEEFALQILDRTRELVGDEP